MRSLAPFCGLLRSLADLHLAHLRVLTAFRTTAFGSFRFSSCPKNFARKSTARKSTDCVQRSLSNQIQAVWGHQKGVHPDFVQICSDLSVFFRSVPIHVFEYPDLLFSGILRYLFQFAPVASDVF